MNWPADGRVKSLTLDEAGHDVLVGLTYQESSLLMAYGRRLAAGSDRGVSIFSVLQRLTQRTDGACDGRSRRIAGSLSSFHVVECR